MLDKLHAVVLSDGVNPVSMSGKHLFDAVRNRILSFAFHKSGNIAASPR